MTWEQRWPTRVINGGGFASWLARTVGAVSFRSVINGLIVKPVVTSGLAVAQAPIRALSRLATGATLTKLVEGSTLALTGEGVRTRSVLGGILGSPNSALNIVSTTVSLVQTTGATGATDTGTWVNPQGATGLPDGLSASNGQSGITNASGKLTLNYAPQFAKTDLEITSVELWFYWNASVPPAGANPPINKLFYGLNSVADVELFSSSVANARLTNPQVFDITAAVGQDWGKLSALATGCSMTTSLALPASTTVVDAVVLVVNATKTVAN
jgi:hypothetical protein